MRRKKRRKREEKRGKKLRKLRMSWFRIKKLNNLRFQSLYSNQMIRWRLKLLIKWKLR